MSKKNTEKSTLKTVNFSLTAPQAKEVYLVGEINQWNPKKNPLKADKNTGTWKGSLKLQPGRYPYKFVVDGEWWSDPSCPIWEWNDHGTQNSILEV